MASNLILDSLVIKNFRGLRDLRINKLGRANLIVGKNNIGKTSVLEALRIYAEPGSLDAMIEVLSERDELPKNLVEEGFRRDPGKPLPVEQLFYGRQADFGESFTMVVGPPSTPEKMLRIKFEESRELRLLHDPEKIIINEDGTSEDLHDYYENLMSHDRGLSIQQGDALRFQLLEQPKLYRLGTRTAKADRLPPKLNYNSTPLIHIPFVRIGPQGLHQSNALRYWDKISLSDVEGEVVESLNIIAPEVTRLAIKEVGEQKLWGYNIRPNYLDATKQRILYAKVKGHEEPIPLKSLGDGVQRMFGIIMSAVNCRDGFLLIDEIENGIHYSVQIDLWRIIFHVAESLDIQVFATTHSSDCISAFQAAAAEMAEEEGVLIRLTRRGDRILATEFDEREMEIAVDGEMELR